MPHSLHRILIALLTAMLLSACATTGNTTIDSRPANGEFVKRTISIDGSTHAYQVFVPATQTLRNDKGQRPVILFLHGSGERGADGVLQTEVGLGPYVRAHAADFPAIVVFPQAPADSEWSQQTALSLATLDAATREFNGDPARTYLTGLSMGGYGTWDLALREPQRFAALVPVCGGLVHPARPSMNVAGLDGEADPFAAAAKRLRDVPEWIFHGALDTTVPPEQSRRMHEALQAQGADVRYTEFPDVDHFSWDPAYNTPALWPWLFAQSLTR